MRPRSSVILIACACAAQPPRGSSIENRADPVRPGAWSPLCRDSRAVPWSLGYAGYTYSLERNDAISRIDESPASRACTSNLANNSHMTAVVQVAVDGRVTRVRVTSPDETLADCLCEAIAGITFQHSANPLAFSYNAAYVARHLVEGYPPD